MGREVAAEHCFDSLDLLFTDTNSVANLVHSKPHFMLLEYDYLPLISEKHKHAQNYQEQGAKIGHDSSTNCSLADNNDSIS